MRLRFSPRPAHVLLLAALPLVLAGCATFKPKGHIEGQIPMRDTSFADSGSNAFRVGAARVDLTPIPGIAMNYSLDGKVSRGFWTRLHARAIYLQDGDENAIVLVSCDLPHIPNGLSDRVAEIVGEKTDPAIDHLGREQIVLSATHTHNGPENFFSSEFYNFFPSPRSGFDPQLFEFLAQRIATAIQRAFAEREDAKLRYRQAKLALFFRNRSLGAFLRNGDSAAFLAGNAAISDACELPEDQTDGRACRAVRTLVEVIEFIDTSAAGKPIATAAFLAAHPTVLSSETEVFSGDLFGVAASLLEQKRLGACAGYDPGVVAFFNGAQGLSRFICGADSGIDPVTEEHLETGIGFRFDWLSLKASHPYDDPDEECDPWDERCTTEEPMPGAAGMGGGQDGRTLWYELGLKEGLRSAGRGEHGRKAVGLEIGGEAIHISRLVADPDTAPKKIPVGSYRIGSIVIAALSGEFTTVMGERIRTAVGAAAITPGSRRRSACC